MTRTLLGRKVLVTGAARGIGRACALALQEAGATVVGIDLAASGEGFTILACDLTHEDQIVTAAAEARRRLGGIDILVNNAGILEERAIGDLTSSHIDRTFAVNVRAAMLCTREVLAHVPKGGRIINVASELAYLGREGASAYVASKAAILGLTRSWARELAPDILVNAVAPGPTDTPLLNFEGMSAAERIRETDNPLGRIGRPEEVAAAVVFLAGPGATLFTGQCLGANGGAVMP